MTEFATSSSTAGRDADLILVGGGLANGLIAWRLRAQRPDLHVLVLEAGETLGGNHTWSFHGGDLTASQWSWIDPLVVHRWAGYEVMFPTRRRALFSGYASITSSRFHDVLSTALGSSWQAGVDVTRVAPQEVELADGRRLRAGAVIDGRGPKASRHLVLGYQKFLGQEVRTTRPHSLVLPILMDATVPQLGGYRFVYVLPLTPDVLLIEDTCYADGAALEAPVLRQRVAGYAAAHDWHIAQWLREEQGVLPIVLGGDVDAYWREAAGVPQSGLAAGLFHPTTGYSLPEAVALAELLCTLPDLSAGPLFEAIRTHATARWHQRRFFRLLNRMLFRAAAPAARWQVMQRFYGLPAGLIERFYAGQPTMADKLRVCTGRPPVPLLAGLRAALDLPRWFALPAGTSR